MSYDYEAMDSHLEMAYEDRFRVEDDDWETYEEWVDEDELDFYDEDDIWSSEAALAESDVRWQNDPEYRTYVLHGVRS